MYIAYNSLAKSEVFVEWHQVVSEVTYTVSEEMRVEYFSPKASMSSLKAHCP